MTYIPVSYTHLWGHEKKLKFTYKEQKEYETIEADIEKLENRLSEIDEDVYKRQVFRYTVRVLWISFPTI